METTVWDGEYIEQTKGKLDFAEGKYCEFKVLALENIQSETREPERVFFF